jgi:hypothetical protein
MAAKQGAAAQALAQGEETLPRVPAPLDNGDDEPPKRAPGRRSQAGERLAQVAQAVDAARPAPQRVAGQWETGMQSLRPSGPPPTLSTGRAVCVARASAGPGRASAPSTPSAPAPRPHTSGRQAWSGASKPSAWCPQGRPPSSVSRGLGTSRGGRGPGRRPWPPPCMPSSFPHAFSSAWPRPGRSPQASRCGRWRSACALRSLRPVGHGGT